MLNIYKHGDYFYVRDGESDRYYHLMYQEEWSADSTIIGLTATWTERPELEIDDKRQDLVTGRHNCKLCPIEKNYIEQYGRESDKSHQPSEAS